MRRSLIHFWPVHLAVVAGAAVATAVLTGSLVVGDSIQASLQDLTLERLGTVEEAVVGDRLFAGDVAAKLGGGALPVLSLRGAAVHADSGARAKRVAVWGVDHRFSELFPGDEVARKVTFDRRQGQIFPSLLVNAALARELGAEVGDEVLVQFESQSEVPRATLLGDSDPTEALSSLRLTVTTVLPDRGLGRFSLTANQTLPLNAYVNLALLQKRLGRPGEVNAVLAAGGGEEDSGDGRGRAPTLRSVLSPGDVGLRWVPGDGWVSLESREFVLRPPVVAAATRAAEQEGRAVLPVLTYLANRMEVGERTLPYSTVTALPLPVPEGFGAWRTGADVPGQRPSQATALPESQPLAPGAVSGDRTVPPPIFLNTWAAADLDAAVGDALQLTFYQVGDRDELTTATAEFRVAAVVAMAGLAADRTLTPEFPGIADADRMSEWDPPFPVDLGLIRPRDEDYWDEWRATPKAFVPLDAGRRLWRNRFGELTAIRIALLPGETAGEAAERLGRGLMDRLSLGALGLAIQPVREQGLAAAAGTTSFAGLFVGFSLFLIVSSALLVALLFRLGVEQRAGELGLRLAAGFRVRSVRRMLLAEGAAMAALGGLLGVGLAALYGQGVLVGLRSWWSPLLASPFLRLDLRPVSLVGGLLLSVVVVLLSITGTLRRLKKVPVVALLAGNVETGEPARKRGRAAKWLAIGSLALAVVLLVMAFTGGEASPAMFFGVGAALLASGFALFALWCRGSLGGAGAGGLTMASAATRNSARNPGRSLLSVVLVGSACFVLVAVAANRRDAGRDPLRRDSGTGGFTLVAESDIALTRALGDAETRTDLGLPAEELAGTSFISLRLRHGEDASCLNLYQPEKPRLLGVPPELVGRGGFRFRGTAAAADNPWSLLEKELEPGVIPAVGDANSVQWILHLGIGKELEMEDDRGRPVRLRIVGTLETSVFQSELLISERAFLEHFPDSGGFAYFLAETPPERIEEVAHLLEDRLARYGFDATPAAEKLEGYLAVEHMYLDTFQALGGLGLLLGTLGLAVVLARNVIERRGELATLRAFGFRRSSLAWMVIAENGFLLVTGMVVGAAAGLVAVAPHLARAAGNVPWGTLAGTLAVVFVVGILAGTVAVATTLRTPLLPALKAER